MAKYSKSTLLGFVLQAWKSLFATRNELLRQHYLLVAAATNTEVEANADLDTLRNKLNASQGEMEVRIVKLNRIVAAWNVMWSSILPAIAACGYLATTWSREGTYLQNARPLLVAACLLLVGAVIGILIQAILVKPLVSLLNRRFGLHDQ